MTVAEFIGELFKLLQERDVYFDTGSYQLEPVDVAGTYDTIEKDDAELGHRCLIDGRGGAK